MGEHATVLYGVVDAAAERFTYAAAAATHPLLIPAGGAPAPLPACVATGLPVGVTAGNRYEAQTLPFPHGSALALCSNAVVDALKVADRDEAGGSGGALAGVIGAAMGGAAKEGAAKEEVADGDAFGAVTAALAAALGETPRDDHTFVWIERREAA